MFVNRPIGRALLAVTEEVNVHVAPKPFEKESTMSKLLSVLIAGVFALAATTGFAQDKKADAPKADAPKAEAKKDGMKKEKKAKKAKKAKAEDKK